MNLCTSLKSNRLSVVLFTFNILLSILGAVFAYKTVSSSLRFFSVSIYPDKLLFADFFIVFLLCFFYFCGILALSAVPLSFLFSFFNSYALFISIKANVLTGIYIAFSCILIAASILFFCIGAQFSAVSSVYFFGKHPKRKSDMIADIIKILLPSILSWLMILSVLSIIM